MSVTSLPSQQPQPSAAFYPASPTLSLFTDYTRASYAAAFGVDAPTGDPTKRPKAWFDTSSQSGEQVSYQYIDNMTSPGKPVVATMTMTSAEAAAINLPGVHSYPAYMIQATDASVIGQGTSLPLNPRLLSSLADANTLATSWGLAPASVVTQMQFSTGPYTINYPADEIRREWVINWKGTPLNVGMFLAEMNANGIGAPGAWDMSGAEPNWISSLPSTVQFTLPPWPDPIRPLLADEALAPSSALFPSAGVVAYRTEMASPYNQNVATPGAPTSDSTATATALATIQAGITAIMASLGVHA